MKSGFTPIELWRSDERLRFLVIGGWNTLFGYVAYVVFYELFKDALNYLLVGLMAHGVALVNAFVCHRFLVFRSSRKLFSDFVRFNLSQLVVLAIGLGALWCLVEGLHLTPLPAQALVTVIAVALSYLAHHYFTFAT